MADTNEQMPALEEPEQNPQQDTESDSVQNVETLPQDNIAEDIDSVDIKPEKHSSKAGSPDNPMRVLEALLFAADEILTIDKIKAIVPGQPDARKIRQLVDGINAQFSKERHPFEVVEVGGGYQFRTVSYYYQWIVQLFKEKSAKKLSIQSLECLAIIAYKQPITKAEIEQVRGVLSDGAMKTLLEKRLVAISGRSEKAGRPLLYATTKEFLAYFGINKIADLPRIEEFESLAKEKLGELTEAELTGMEAEKTATSEDGSAPETIPENGCVPSENEAAPEMSANSDTPAETSEVPGTDSHDASNAAEPAPEAEVPPVATEPESSSNATEA